MLVVGSRSGATIAVIFFAVLFGALAYALTRSVRGRVPARLGAIIGTLLFVASFGGFYATSISGFYDASFSASVLTVRYLLPFSYRSLELASLRCAEARPAFKGTWRVHVLLENDNELVSALTSPATANDATGRIRDAIPGCK